MNFVYGLLGALIFSAGALAQSPVNWSVLPSSRTGAPNEEITFLATIVNGADVTMSCQPRFGGFFTRAGGVSGQAKFYTSDNGVLGTTANAVVDIPAGGQQNYVVSVTVDRAFSGGIPINIQCTDPDDVPLNLPRIAQVNDFQVVIEAGNPPDIVSIGATLSNDGIARIDADDVRRGIMTVAAVNIGNTATDYIVIPDITGFSTLQEGYRPQICETNSQSVCTGPSGAFARVSSWPTDETRLFAVWFDVDPALGVPLYPDDVRLRVRATPEPAPLVGTDASNYDPAWQAYIDTWFGGTSSAIQVHRNSEFQGVHAPVMQCSTEPSGDTADEWRRAGGLMTITPADTANGNVLADGFLEFADFQFDEAFERHIPVQLTAPRAGGVGTLTLAGAGTGTPVPTDVSYPVTLINNAASGGWTISWDAQPSGQIGFNQAGSIRCAPAPANGSVAGTTLAQRDLAFTGTMSASPHIAGFSSVLINNGVVTDGDGDPVIFTGFQPHRPDIPDLTEEQIQRMYDPAMSAFRIADQVGYGAVVAPTRWRILNTDPAISCGVMGWSGTAQTSAQGAANNDAGATILRDTDDDPPELGDGECVL